jgi:hypothetical protein
MSCYSPELYKRICDTLLKCREFESDSKLWAALAHPQINHWRDFLPAATDRQSRVEAIVDFFQENRNRYGVNALVLLLRILSEKYDPNDALHDELKKLACELQNELGASESTTIVAHEEAKNSQQSAPDTLRDRFLTLTIDNEGLELRVHRLWLLVMTFIIATTGTLLGSISVQARSNNISRLR